MSDHGSTALPVTYIGYLVITPTNLGLHKFTPAVRPFQVFPLFLIAGLIGFCPIVKNSTVF